MRASPSPGPVPRILILLAGIILPQCILFGPSLVGARLLLPLDYLEARNVYLPTTPAADAGPAGYIPTHRALGDAVFFYEIYRRYAVSEVRAGRLPLWNPYNFCGSPFLAANQGAVFSPLRIPDYLFPSPVTLAWDQLLRALLAGIGAYLFFRRVMRVGFWPAAVGAWCYPLSAFFVIWVFTTLVSVVAWLPWLLLATDRAVRNPRGWGGIGLALVTAAIMVAGHAAMGAQVLLMSGFYGLWCLIDQFGGRPLAIKAVGASILALGAGWLMGVLLSSPQNLPTAAYMQTSSRITSRLTGFVESPPIGWHGLLQLVIPKFYGSNERQTLDLGRNLWPESGATGYAGLLIFLGLAPLGWLSRRHRSINIFWLVIGLFAAAQVLNLPLVARVFSFFPFNLLRNNRMVFMTGWGVLAMGVAGLDVMWQQMPGRRWRWWCWGPAAVAATLGVYCLVLYATPATTFHDRIAALLPHLPVSHGLASNWSTPQAIESLRHWFQGVYLAGACWCGMTILFWLAFRANLFRRAWARGAFVALILAELLIFAFGLAPQSDPNLYYPPISALQAVAHAQPGRVCGVFCLPANLNQVPRLRDLRGYDATDPIRMIELLQLFRDTHYPSSPSYAVTQWYVPRPSPLGDMLNLRYLIHRHPPKTVAAIQSPDYWVVENPNALPRPYIPRRVQVVNDHDRRLALLADPNFNPRQVAYVEGPDDLAMDGCQGSARIVDEVPSRVTIALDMHTPGLVVLADLWDSGWRAYVDGQSQPIYRTNHAVRGVVVHPGQRTLEFRYEPASFIWGVRLFMIGAVILAVWAVGVTRCASHDRV